MRSNKTGATIARLRKEQKMTQQELAKKLGVTDKAVSRWETGKGYPDVEMLVPLASLLGVSVDDLLADTPEELKRNYVPSYEQDGWRINSGEKRQRDDNIDYMEAFDRRLRRKGGGICLALVLWEGVRTLMLFIFEPSFANGLQVILSALMAVGLLYCGYSWLRYVGYVPFLVLDSYRVLALMLMMAPEFTDVAPNLQEEVHFLIFFLGTSVIAGDIAAIVLITQSESVKDYLYSRRTR